LRIKVWLRKVKCPAIKLLVLIGRVRRRWSRVVRGGKKSLYTSGPKAMGIIILLLRVNLLRRDINVAPLSLNLRLDTGRVKNFGLAREGLQSRVQKAAEENISIFVKTKHYAYS